MKEIYLDPHNIPNSKENVIHKIKSAPITTFDYDNRNFDDFLHAESEAEKCLIANNYTTEHIITSVIADFSAQTEDMIFNQIREIIKRSGMHTLYVLNKQQILEALQLYVKNQPDNTPQ